jgi:putative transposase
MRHEFIRVERANYPVSMLCRVLEVSRSGFYKWAAQPESARAKQDSALLVKIRAIHKRSRGTYGSPRVFMELHIAGERIGRKRVERLMHADGLQALNKRKFVKTTDSKHGYPVAENILNREFDVGNERTVWAGDITYIRTNEGWLYLAVLLNLVSRRVIGWSMAGHMRQELTLDALSMAVHSHKPNGDAVHHSDRGSQYAANDYQKSLKKLGLTCSMSRKGNCWDNAVVESFFASLKCECLYRQSFKTRNEARQAVFDYIEVFYNRQRLHSSLGYKTPVQFEEMMLAA